MAAVQRDRIGVPGGPDEQRVLLRLWSRAHDALAGRVVWSVSALPGGHAAGRRLRKLPQDGFEVVPLDFEATWPSDTAEGAAYAHGAELVEPGLAGRIRPGDV